MPVHPSILYPRAENVGFCFTGETRWEPAVLTRRQAETFLACPNRAGRPNADIIRRIAGHARGRPHTHWQIDFPPHSTLQEAALHERPFALLRRRTGASTPDWWHNPHAKPELRSALSRLERFLATPCEQTEPSWSWVDSELLPDASLLIVARDDDFTHAVLASAHFTTWWQTQGRKAAPADVLIAFQFPWSPATPLGALSREQQEIRSRVIRAHLADDGWARDELVRAAYRLIPTCS